MPRKILIVAGGTGGHLYPGIALAHALKARGAEPVFAVRRGDLGREVLVREGFPVFELTGQGLPRGISLKLLTFPLKLAAGFHEAGRLLTETEPAAAIGMGGYLSFPVLMAARRRGVPTLIHEQNVIPGLANRLLGRWVDGVAVSFEPSLAHFSNPSITLTGLPIRQDIGQPDVAEARRRLELDPDRQTFLIFGGSLGAHRLNESVARMWSRFSIPTEFQVLHITGPRDAEAVRQMYQAYPFPSRILPYCHAMPDAYAAATLVICRSGASTVAELAAARRPAILVPYPHATANHQLANAQVLAEAGVAKIIADADATPDRLRVGVSEAFGELFGAHAQEQFQRLGQRLHIHDAALQLAQRIDALAPTAKQL